MKLHSRNDFLMCARAYYHYQCLILVACSLGFMGNCLFSEGTSGTPAEERLAMYIRDIHVKTYSQLLSAEKFEQQHIFDMTNRLIEGKVYKQVTLIGLWLVIDEAHEDTNSNAVVPKDDVVNAIRKMYAAANEWHNPFLRIYADPIVDHGSASQIKKINGVPCAEFWAMIVANDTTIEVFAEMVINDEEGMMFWSGDLLFSVYNPPSFRGDSHNTP